MSDTVCIAATCMEDSEPRIILCADTKMTFGDVAAWEGAVKCHQIFPGWFVMLSGDSSKAKEVIDRYISNLNTFVHLGPTDVEVIDQLRVPLRQQRTSDVDEYVISQTGLTYREFLEKADKFPDVARVELFEGVKRVSLGCDLIIVGFTTGRPRIYGTDATGRLVEQDTMCSIGCGYIAALASMSRREYNRNLDIHEALYYVYEAKRASEGVPGVGKQTHMLVLAPLESQQAHHTRALGLAGLDILQKQDRAFGIHPFKKLASVRRLPLEECNSEWVRLKQSGQLTPE